MERSKFTAKLILPAALELLGIFFVTIGFVLLFPLKYLPISAVYVVPSNVDLAVTLIAVGIVILVMAFIINLKAIKKQMP
jgi:hypothetical protein